LRVASLLQLQQQLSIDTYAEGVLEQAQVIIRLLGGRSYWSYGLEVVQETVQCTDAALIVMPGDDVIDQFNHSLYSPLSAVNQLWRYFNEGGVENIVNALQFVANICLKTAYNPLPPQPVPRVGLYTGKWVVELDVLSGDWGQWEYSKSLPPLLPTPQSWYSVLSLIT